MITINVILILLLWSISMWARFESRLVPAPFRFPMAEHRSIGRWTRLTREFQLSCSLAGAPISRRKLPQQQQQRSQQNIRSFQHDPVCLHAPIILIKRNKQVLGSRFWNRFLDQTVPVPEYSSQPYCGHIRFKRVTAFLLPKIIKCFTWCPPNWAADLTGPRVVFACV